MRVATMSRQTKEAYLKPLFHDTSSRRDEWQCFPNCSLSSVIYSLFCQWHVALSLSWKELAWAFSSPLLLEIGRDYALASEPSLKEVVYVAALHVGQKQPQLRSYSAAAPLDLESKEYKDKKTCGHSHHVWDDSKHHNVGDEEDK